MEAPYNSSESSDEDSKDSKGSLYYESCMMDSPRLSSRAALKMPKAPLAVTDSIPTFTQMKTLNSSTRFDRITRPPVWKWIGERTTTPLRDKQVKIFVSTWNLLGKLPALSEAQQLLNPEVAHDIYIIGTEECQRSIAASFLWKSKGEWESMIGAALGEGFSKLCSGTLMATHVVIFVKNELIPIIKNIETEQVATGVGNTIGNKGGVGITFCLGDTSFMIIGCHLAGSYFKQNNRIAGQFAVERRVADFERINSSLTLLQDSSILPTKATERADVTIVFGDMNYRVNSTASMIKYLLEQELYEVIIMNDQLSQLQRLGKTANGLEEGKIEFAPTYRFYPGSDAYNIGLDRIPSYTDRILFNCKSPGALRLISYDSNNLIKTSDHRPVFAQFLCKFKGQFKEDAGNLTKQEAVERITKQEYMFGQTRSATCQIF